MQVMTQEKQTEINILIKIAEEKRRNLHVVGSMVIPQRLDNAYRLFIMYAAAQEESRQAERALRAAQGL